MLLAGLPCPGLDHAMPPPPSSEKKRVFLKRGAGTSRFQNGGMAEAVLARFVKVADQKVNAVPAVTSTPLPLLEY